MTARATPMCPRCGADFLPGAAACHACLLPFASLTGATLIQAIEADRRCIFCHLPVSVGALSADCARCHSPHHVDCWAANGGCGQVGCPGVGTALGTASEPIATGPATAARRGSRRQAYVVLT